MASCCKTTSMAVSASPALHEAGTPWDPLTTHYAAEKGS
jgi:hypothetical protein